MGRLQGVAFQPVKSELNLFLFALSFDLLLHNYHEGLLAVKVMGHNHLPIPKIQTLTVTWLLVIKHDLNLDAM